MIKPGFAIYSMVHKSSHYAGTELEVELVDLRNNVKIELNGPAYGVCAAMLSYGMVFNLKEAADALNIPPALTAQKVSLLESPDGKKT